MKLIVNGSSSKGNSYLLVGRNETLILEAGVKLSEVKKALNFDLSNVVGCAITHEHQDHAKYIREYLAAGIDIYTSQGTIDASALKSHRLHAVTHGVKFYAGEFHIMPFDVIHDAKQPLGFLINHTECGVTAFVTDTQYLPYKFKGLNNLLIEANFDNDIIDERVSSGADKSLRDRVLFSHLSIQTLVELLHENDTTRLNNLVLLHLSDSNSNAKEFKETVEKALPGKTVWVAEKNMIINLDKTPF